MDFSKNVISSRKPNYVLEKLNAKKMGARSKIPSNFVR